MLSDAILSALIVGTAIGGPIGGSILWATRDCRDKLSREVNTVEEHLRNALWERLTSEEEATKHLLKARVQLNRLLESRR